MKQRATFLLASTLALVVASSRSSIAQGFSPSMPAGNGTARDEIWRCSLDRRTYQVQLSNALLRITPVRSGGLSASLVIKVDKKGRQKITGLWQSELLTGFLLIAQIGDQNIQGYMLVPQPGAAPNVCDSRTSAILANIGGAQHQTSCALVNVSWNIESGLTLEQALAVEVEQEALAAIQAPAAPPMAAPQIGDPSPEAPAGYLVGTWASEQASAVSYKYTELTLRPDGTYTKIFKARPTGGGGGVIGAPSLGGTHNGTWAADGYLVHLSGDGNWPPSDHDLRQFRKLQ